MGLTDDDWLRMASKGIGTPGSGTGQGISGAATTERQTTGQQPSRPKRDGERKSTSGFSIRRYIAWAVALIFALLILGYVFVNIPALQAPSMLIVSIIIVTVPLLLVAAEYGRLKRRMMPEEGKTPEPLGPTDMIVMVAFVIFLVSALIFVVVWGTLTGPLGGTRALIVAFGVAGLVALLLEHSAQKSGTKVPAQPHSMAVVTIFGSKTDIEVKDGIYPTLRNVLEYAIDKAGLIDQDIENIKAITQDKIEITVSPKIFWRARIDKFREYIEAGGSAMVETLIDNVVPQVVTNWIATHPLADVLKLDADEVYKLLLKIAESKAAEEGEGEKKQITRKSVEVLMGIEIPAFHMHIVLVDRDVVNAMKQEFIENQQAKSEPIETNAELSQTKLIYEKTKEITGKAPDFTETFWNVRDSKIGRETGVGGAPPGTRQGFAKGNISNLDYAALTYGGVFKKSAEGKPTAESEGQQKSLTSYPEEGQPEGEPRKEGAWKRKKR